jgi:DNA-binding transcriptional regulator YiaG
VLVRVKPDGSEEVMAVEPLARITPEEVEAAAAADPDARSFTPEELAKVRRVPRDKTLRRALGLTPEEFAARFRIPIGTLRDWEQGRSENDWVRVIYDNKFFRQIKIECRERPTFEAHGPPVKYSTSDCIATRLETIDRLQ